MSMTITQDDVRQAVQSTIEDVIEEYKDDPDTDRETVIERLDEECDTIWGQLVMQGLISHYDVNDLVNTAQSSATIIQVANEDAWVEDDHGLWDGLTYGVLASIAYFTLRNLLYKAMDDAGHDTNDDCPFASTASDEDDEA